MNRGVAKVIEGKDEDLRGPASLCRRRGRGRRKQGGLRAEESYSVVGIMTE